MKAVIFWYLDHEICLLKLNVFCLICGVWFFLVIQINDSKTEKPNKSKLTLYKDAKKDKENDSIHLNLYHLLCALYKLKYMESLFYVTLQTTHG